MTEVADFERLARNWIYWSEVAQLANVSVSTSCGDCAILFSSSDYCVHLRKNGEWWSVDTVGDRRHRNHDTAGFSNYSLAEKYLTWIWGSAARSVVRAPVLGAQLYARGFDSGVEAIPVREGVFELRSPQGRAVLVEPYATIFSHLIAKSGDQIELMLRSDLDG